MRRGQLWVALVVWLYLYAGFLGERQVRAYLRTLLGPAESAEVETRGQGYLLWWRGEWREVRARGHGIRLPNGLTIARLTLEIPRLRTWPWRRLPQPPQEALLEADFREEALQAFLEERAKPLRPSRVRFHVSAQGALLETRLKIGGKEHSLRWRGLLGLSGRAEVVFMPSVPDVQASPLPPQALEVISRAFNPVVDLSVYPLEVRLENLKQREGELTVMGRAEAKEEKR